MSNIKFLDGGYIYELNKLHNDSGEYAIMNNPEIIKKLHQKYIDMGCDYITTANYGFKSLKFDNWKELTLKSCQLLNSIRNGKFNIMGCLPSYYESYQEGEINESFEYFYIELIKIMEPYVDSYILDTCICPLQLIKTLNYIFKSTKKDLYISVYPSGKIEKKHLQFLCNMEYSQIKGILINCCSFNEMKEYYNKNIKLLSFNNYSFGFYCNKFNEKEYNELSNQELLLFLDNFSKNKNLIIGGCCGYNSNDIKILKIILIN